MLKKTKLFLVILCAAALLLGCTVTAFATDDELEINSVASAAVGDTVTYSLYLSDADDPVEGIQMYIYYDPDYLTVDPESLTYEKFDGVVQNADNENFVTFNWTDITNLADFSSKALLVSVDFTVTQAGSAEIAEFIQELYGDDMTYLKAYTLTYDISVNGEVVSSDNTPVIATDDDIINNRQGGFINYLDGMGEENSPNAGDDHDAVIGDKELGTMYVTEVVNANEVIDVESDSSVSKYIIIAAVVIIIAAIVVVLILMNKSKNNQPADNSFGGEDVPQLENEIEAEPVQESAPDVEDVPQNDNEIEAEPEQENAADGDTEVLTE